MFLPNPHIVLRIPDALASVPISALAARSCCHHNHHDDEKVGLDHDFCSMIHVFGWTYFQRKYLCLGHARLAV